LEPFFTLHLPIDESTRTIKDSFQIMTTKEDLGDRIVKQISIEELPKILILHLKRFTFSKQEGSSKKISKKVQFFSQLYLDDYIISKTKIPENDKKKEIMIYIQLFAIMEKIHLEDIILHMFFIHVKNGYI